MRVDTGIVEQEAASLTSNFGSQSSAGKGPTVHALILRGPYRPEGIVLRADSLADQSTLAEAAIQFPLRPVGFRRSFQPQVRPLTVTFHHPIRSRMECSQYCLGFREG